MRIPLDKTPLALRRRAVQRLESARGTRLGPITEGTRLGSEVCPMYRPDMAAIAYYEFELISGTRPLVTATATALRLFEREAAAGPGLAPRPIPARRGFLILSAGPHDFPIPHWSLDGIAPSRFLEQRAAPEKGAVARIIKLDALAYVAENEQGERLASLGDLPPILSGLPHDLRRGRRGISGLVARPPETGPDQDQMGVHRVEKFGPEPPKLEPVQIESWSQLKERYANAFGPFLDDLQRRAAGAWEIDRLVEEFGEGIFVGQTHTVPLLDERAKIDVTGDAVNAVEVKLVEAAAGQGAVTIRAVSLPAGPRADLELRITYGNGEVETLRFFVVSRDIPSNPPAERPPVVEGPP